MSKKCLKCGATLKDDARFCVQCGEPVPEKEESNCVCPVCGKPLNPDARFCVSCGTKVNDEELMEMETTTMLEASENELLDFEKTIGGFPTFSEYSAKQGSKMDSTVELENNEPTVREDRYDHTTEINDQNTTPTMGVTGYYDDKPTVLEEGYTTMGAYASPQMNEEKEACPICGSMQKKGATFCTNCGNQMGVGQNQPSCPQCGSPLTGDGSFCTHCGYSLQSKGSGQKNNILLYALAGGLFLVVLVLGYFVFFNGKSDGGVISSDPPACEAGEEWNEDTNSCEPISCVAGEVWNATTKTCEKEDPKTACAAKTGYTWDDENAECVDTVTYNRNQEIKACSASGKEWNYSTNTCEAPAVDGYKPGTYILNYEMSIRTSPTTTSTRITTKKQGSSVSIVEVKRGSTDSSSVWGKLSDGNWICIKDTSYYYLRQ